MPPAKTGIADYSAELLPELARYYDIKVIVDQETVDNAWISTNFSVHDIAWLEKNATRFDRILYQFGNSHYHKHMFSLVRRFPGIVVLHDFYLGHVVGWMDDTGYMPGAIVEALYHSHGYPGIAKAAVEGRDAAIWAYPMNKAVLDHATGVIVHSRYAIEAATRWYGPEAPLDWHVVPALRVVPRLADRREVRQRIGVFEDDFLICSFGHIGPSKQNHRLLKSFLASRLAADRHCRLVFVGENNFGYYDSSMLELIETSEARDRICITGYASVELYHDFLAAADVAVQLRTLSRGETSRSVLDVLGHGIPLIVNAHGPMAELPEDCVIMLPDEFVACDLVGALEALWKDPGRRAHMGEMAREWVRQHHHPARVGEIYRDVIEVCAAHAPSRRYPTLLTDIAKEYCDADLGPTEIEQLARCVAANLPRRFQRQLLLDISVLVQTDLHTGIQRVVRNLMGLLLEDDTLSLRVEPVYYHDGRYLYARRFVEKILGSPRIPFEDRPVEPGPRDIFLGIDLALYIFPEAEAEFSKFRALGASICFVVYDLLPMLRRDCFPPEEFEHFSQWMKSVVTLADKLICISRTTAEDVQQWVQEHPTARSTPLEIDHFHLGADDPGSRATIGMPEGFSDVMAAIALRATFLAVGTVEPRKGYAQLLAGFDLLWRNDIKVNLVIVGKQGWMVEALSEKLRHHPQLGTRLFWLERASDENLRVIYAVSTALIAASEGEGFGLPLIEAARLHVPIIARDLRVFREVMGDDAYYFSGLAPEDLAAAVVSWMELKATYRAPMGSRIRWLTWQASKEQLLRVLFSTP